MVKLDFGMRQSLLYVVNTREQRDENSMDRQRSESEVAD
jgi:hypothetical protein